MPARLVLLLIALVAAVALALPGVALADPVLFDPVQNPLWLHGEPDPPPRVDGGSHVGDLLTATDGTWATDPMLTREWLRCPPDRTTCEYIGETGSTYTLTAADLDQIIKLRVTADDGIVKTEADSNEIIPVATASPPPAPTPTPSPPATTAPTPAPAAQPAQPAKSSPALKRLSPFPLLVIGGRVSGSVTTFSSVRLRRVPRGATVRISCSGPSCPFGRSAATLRTGSRMTLAKLQGRLRAGTVITITVRKGKTLGKYTRLRIRSGTAPARVDRCVRPGSSKPVPCG